MKNTEHLMTPIEKLMTHNDTTNMKSARFQAKQINKYPLVICYIAIENDHL